MSRQSILAEINATKGAMSTFTSKIAQVEQAVAGISSDNEASLSAGIVNLQNLKDEIMNILIPGLPDQVRVDLSNLVQSLTNSYIVVKNEIFG